MINHKMASLEATEKVCFFMLKNTFWSVYAQIFSDVNVFQNCYFVIFSQLWYTVNIQIALRSLPFDFSEFCFLFLLIEALLRKPR